MDNINIDNIIPINNLPEYTEEQPELEQADVTQITQLPLDYDSVSEMVNALCPHPDIIQKLEAAFDPVNVQEFDEDFFNQDYGVISDVSELKRALSRLIIRFDDSPKNYTKSDYDYLVTLLYQTLLFLYYNNPKGTIINAWSQTADSGRTPSEKLVRDTIDALQTLLEGNIQQVSEELQTEITGIVSDITRLAELIAENESDIYSLQTTKQDILTPGDNIQINGNVISATDTIYDDTEVRGLIDVVDQKVDNLDEFTCGTITPTTTNFVEGIDYTVHEALQRTANLFEGYQDEIDDINALIPNQTTTSNQLADKAFVNSTVATNAANFRGNWANYTAIPTNVNDYPADYSGSKTPTNNDYLVVQDGTDYGSSYTGMWRFIYTGDWSLVGKSGWAPQYRVGSAFTAEQQAAIDSGITSAKVTKYEGYNSSIGALQTDKLDKVYTANKIYGTNNLGTQTTYTAGTGIAFENGQINSTIQEDLLPLIYAGL